MDSVAVLNLLLCIVIVILSVIVYFRKKATLPLCTGIAFGLFGLSHLMTLLGLADVLATFLMVDRTIAYLVIVYALIRLWKANSAK
jgi:hypothetical protein